jgi:Tfp pilus assembly protein PilE
MPSTRASFTLIELLVVIAVVAVLSIVVVVVLNPAQLLKQTRDVNRLADMDTLTRAVQFYEAQTLSASPGNASTTYFSLVDPAATTTAGTNCAGIPLTPPTGWTYHCAASSTLKRIDGTGWLPVDFESLSSRPFGSLPVDPTNTSSSGLYYSYTPGGSFELTALLEADRYKYGGARDRESTDGGAYDGLYQAGTKLNMTPPTRSSGLVGYWTFDEGSGTTAQDTSGKGNHGTLANSPSWTSGKVGGALSFSGSAYVNIGSGNNLNLTGDFTLSAWVKTANSDSGMYILSRLNACLNASNVYSLHRNPSNLVVFITSDNANTITSTITIHDDQWHHVAGTISGTTMRLYIDGVQEGPTVTVSTSRDSFPSASTEIGNVTVCGSNSWQGQIDETRIYNRALTAAEIEAIYNATK